MREKRRQNSHFSTQISFALALILPVFALVVYDILLWFWRLVTLTPSSNLQPGDTIQIDPAIPGTSKSEIKASELEKVRDTDKPASD